MSATIPAGIVAVIRAESGDIAYTIARGLAEAGVDGVEITLTVPGALDVIARLATELDLPVGAGTVRTRAECESAIARGATFVVSPDFQPDVVIAAHAAGIAAAPGALTPSEVGRCLAAGADAVKLFPVGAVGGPSYVRTMSEPFPGVHWVVSGGIGDEQVREYRDAGVLTICLGGALIDRTAAASGDIAGVARHGRAALARARA